MTDSSRTIRNRPPPQSNTQSTMADYSPTSHGHQYPQAPPQQKILGSLADPERSLYPVVLIYHKTSSKSAAHWQCSICNGELHLSEHSDPHSLLAHYRDGRCIPFNQSFLLLNTAASLGVELAPLQRNAKLATENKLLQAKCEQLDRRLQSALHALEGVGASLAACCTARHDMVRQVIKRAAAESMESADSD